MDHTSADSLKRPAPRPVLEQETRPGLHVVTFPRPGCREVFVHAAATRGESPQALFDKAARAVRDTGCRVVSQEVVGASSAGGDGFRMLESAFGNVSWPVTWLEEGSDSATPPRPRGGLRGGTQIWAVAGLPVAPLEFNGRIVGSMFEDASARYCRLGGLMAHDAAQSREAQARAVFDQMVSALASAGLDFRHTVRTWFYNDDLLSWYDDFNKVRNAFFRENGVYDGLVPASTGVGGRNAAGTALVGGLLAVQPKDKRVQAVAVPSPLQCPALEYGSSFSRAVELATPDHRRLYVSGTASIAPDGNTAHIGDAAAQIALTMDVVNAILESRGMAWRDVSRALAYFKHPADIPAFNRHCASAGIPPLPGLLVTNDICRDDLLFEMEVDAVTA